jgi:hypothetical protein
MAVLVGVAVVLYLIVYNQQFKEISWKEFFSDFLGRGIVSYTLLYISIYIVFRSSSWKLSISSGCESSPTVPNPMYKCSYILYPLFDSSTPTTSRLDQWTVSSVVSNQLSNTSVLRPISKYPCSTNPSSARMSRCCFVFVFYCLAESAIFLHSSVLFCLLYSSSTFGE